MRIDSIEPVNILCVGRNYRDGDVGTRDIEAMELFMKPTTAVQKHNGPILLPGGDASVHCEGELAVVIGRAAMNVAEDDALDCVLGYTIANDVTDRGWQTREGAPKWMRGKGFDTFCPLGPVIVTADEITDPDSLVLSTIINGRTVRRGSTAQMLRSVRRIISEISRRITLLPGTVILTGAPPVPAEASELDQPLQAGDEVTVVIGGIGRLTNPVAMAPTATAR